MIEEEGKGVIVYINKLREGGGLIDELKAYEKSSSASENGSVVHKMDNKDYGIGAQILRDLGVHKMKLLTNTTSRRTGIIGYGLEIVETLEVK